jgi:hypothetical protein
MERFDRPVGPIYTEIELPVRALRHKWRLIADDQELHKRGTAPPCQPAAATVPYGVLVAAG